MENEQQVAQSEGENTQAPVSGGADPAPENDSGGQEKVTLAGEAVKNSPEGDTSEGREADGKADADWSELNVPDGVNVDDEALSEIVSFAKSNGLSKEAAEELVKFHAERVRQGAEQAIAHFEARSLEWAEAARKDPELSKDFDAVKGRISRAVKQYGSDELVELLSDPLLGVGNHPAVLKFIARVGASLEEDTVGGTTGASSGGGEDRALRALYPSMFS